MSCCHAVRDFLLRYPATPEQAVVLICLSLFGHADGSRIYPGRDNLLRLARIRSSEIKPAIDHWLALGDLVLVAESRPKHAAEYRVDFARMTELLRSTAERSAKPHSVPQRNRDKEHHSVPD